MKRHKKNFKKYKQSGTIARIKQIDNIIFVLLLLMLLVIPLTVKLHVIHFISPIINNSSYLLTGDKTDFFSYFKFILLIIFTLIITLLFFIKLFVFNYQIQKTKTNLFLILFILWLLISASLSSFKTIALFGFYDKHNGLLTFLCYSFIVFIATNIKFNKKMAVWFFYFVTPFIIINSILILLHFYGYNILKLNFIKMLLYSNQASYDANSSFKETLPNEDYTSGFSAIFICIFFILSIFEKRKKLKIINIILLFISFAMLLGTLASSGFFTISILLPLFLIILLIKKEYKKVLLGLSLLIGFSLVYIPLQSHNNGVWGQSIGAVVNLMPKENGSKTAHPKAPLVIENQTGSSKFVLPGVPNKGYDFGSGRGYIWKNTLPVIFKQPIKGYGLDTLPYYFPQYKLEQLSGIGAIETVDKPHSLYLEIAFGTGITGLILFLLMIGIPIFKASSNIIRNKEQSFISASFPIVIIFALLAYLIQGLVNDPNIGTDIFFFVFLGVLNSIRLDKDWQ